MSEPVAKLVTTKPDAEVAADLKARAILASQPMIALCEEARAAGFDLHIGWGPGPLGNIAINHLHVAKVY